MTKVNDDKGERMSRPNFRDSVAEPPADPLELDKSWPPRPEVRKRWEGEPWPPRPEAPRHKVRKRWEVEEVVTADGRTRYKVRAGAFRVTKEFRSLKRAKRTAAHMQKQDDSLTVVSRRLV